VGTHIFQLGGDAQTDLLMERSLATGAILKSIYECGNLLPLWYSATCRRSPATMRERFQATAATGRRIPKR
jgi:hypothetical protein